MTTPVTNPFNDFVFVNATPADRGSFTLALDKALDKLEKFQLPDPSYFVLQWVQAIVASGAQTIKITFEATRLVGQYELVIVFDGPGYTARELQSLYDHVFLSGRDRGQDRLRELALGWLSASSLKPTKLAISCNGWTRVRDKNSGAGKAGEQTAQLPEGTTLPGHMLEVSGRGAFAFDTMISSGCSDVPINLFLNGAQVSHPGGATGVPWPNRPFKNGPTQGVMGATYGAGSTSQIAFLRYGVAFVSRSEPALQPPVILRVSDNTLSKNVSQTDVVRDEAYDEFLGRLRSEMKAMGLSLTGKRVPSYQRDSLNRYLQAYIGSNLDIRALEDPNRLALLGADYKSLLEYPVFCANKGVYRSMADLHSIYKKQGSLLYCLEPAARAVAWAGVLLVLEPEEVAVLRKFFPNLIGLSLDEVRVQSRMGRSAVAEAEGAPLLARIELEQARRFYNVGVPDCYPTGIAVLQPRASRYGTAMPGLPLTLSVEYLDTAPPNHTEVVNLRHAIEEKLDALKEQLGKRITAQDADRGFSRSRAAEIYCEILNYQLTSAQSDSERQSQVALARINDLPLIGLEDGRLVSPRDIAIFLNLVPQVYVGGAFVEGLESGALDPMPEAAKLLQRLYPAQSLVPTERIRARLTTDTDLRFELRRQGVIRGLGTALDPERALAQFTSQAAEEAAELARIEQEYRQALEGPALFVKPDEERLATLAAQSDEEVDLPLLDLTAGSSTVAPTVRLSDLPTPSVAPTIPSLESDTELCRKLDPDLFPERDTVQLERWEDGFSMRLASCAAGTGKIFMLRGNDYQGANIPQPVRGFLRAGAQQSGLLEAMFKEGLEQLTIKAVHAFHEGPTSPRMRRALRQWLLHLCCGNPERLLAAEQRPNELFDLAVVPCLGGKYLSWRTLLESAQRVGETVVHSGPSGLPCPQREVILMEQPMTPELLSRLGFPNLRQHRPEEAKTFDDLYRSTRRDLASVLSGQATPLLQTNLVEQLASDASLWKRWRSGFLSWDRESSVMVMNPNHKIGKKLAQRFATDPSWSRIFASALFSTVNRGLEEVEDRHERAFLETLVETLD